MSSIVGVGKCAAMAILLISRIRRLVVVRIHIASLCCCDVNLAIKIHCNMPVIGNTNGHMAVLEEHPTENVPDGIGL